MKVPLLSTALATALVTAGAFAAAAQEAETNQPGAPAQQDELLMPETGQEALGGTTADAPAAVPLETVGNVGALPVQLTATQLTGAAVEGSGGEQVGNVADLVINPQGEVTDVVVDVGGFLGIGARAVALPLSEMDIQWDTVSDDLRIVAPMTREDIEALPPYQG